ncbi:Outer membrane transporter, OMPP1/FadL/TodX family [Rubellimicrobium mesophilum DSM 19309]|uniref:Outer membrane transporter, OMPP1/FadL/TodX family n=1 Tax=Rubellimicrobium mesophilum DSM 19309 TaxID=442562 RepID=A0A017HGI1_9RHOB|nr:outer membrane protein transport protein [Rubellimicrobium mesophilum]EYD73572.1 Outer membrane transporter, OMPP1/FadL/TodX family [Rubellimicrobium mesophilum DSM 19309]
MKRTASGAGALLLLSTSIANAGALDRTGQPVDVLFQDGNYAELSFSYTVPDVQGSFTDTNPLIGATESGDAAADFGLASLSFKSDLSDRFSLAVIIDHPFGADVDYRDADPTYPISNSQAEFESLAVTALGRYKLDDNFSIHAGVRFLQVKADLLSDVILGFDPVANAPVVYNYDGDFESDDALGYVVGVAYERPEIALRVALTYSSETDFSHETTYTTTLTGVPAPFTDSGETAYSLPQSVNLDFQTGIAPDTLLFGSIRWVDWSATEINAYGYGVVPGAVLPFNPVVEYDDDYVTYTLGVGRQFTDKLAASAAVIYEPSIGTDFDPTTGEGGISNLSPTDGQLGVQIAANYAVTDNVELGVGVRYTRLGGGTTRLFGAEFDDNDAITAGMRIGYRF